MNEKHDKIQMDGVFSKGYGIIYKFVMTDHELSIEAKAIYSYFCACAGNGTTAFPSRSKVLNDLQISKNTYYLNEKASVEAFATKEAETNKNISIAENWDTAKCDTENEDSDLWDTEICDTTNNSNTNNKNNIISPSITDADRMTDDISISAVLENAISGEPIPNSLLFDEVKRIELVHALSEWDTFSSSRAWFGHDGTANHDTYIMAVNAIVDMLDPSSKPLHLAGNSVSYRRFADELCRHIQTGCYPSGRKYYTISEILMDVQGKYKYALKNYSVQNKTGIDEVIRLTDKGKAFITDYLDDPYYFENYKKFERKFNIRDKSELPIETDKVDRLLTDSNIEALIYAAGHPVFKNQKPSLYYLYSSIFCRASESKPGYLDNCSRAKCKEFLSKGIYYSIAEYLEFLDEISPGLPDTIYGTRARGIYLSNENCIFVYTSKKYDNKLIKINIKGERGLINSAEYLERFTEIRRVIPFLNDYGYTMEMKKYLKEAYINKPYALIISDGDMLAYATATGNAKGTIKEDTTKMKFRTQIL